MLQRLDLALAHQGGQLQRQAGTAHHFVHGGGQRHRQAHSAVFRVRAHPDPAAFGNGLEPFGKPGRGPHDPVFQPRGVQVAIALQGGQHLVTELTRLAKDRMRHVIGGFRELLGLAQGLEIHHVVEQKLVIIDGGAVRHGKNS